MLRPNWINWISSILVLLLFLLGCSACLLVFRYFVSVKETQDLQFRYAVLQSTVGRIQGLVNDSVEYSRRNPDLDPLLFQFNLKLRPSTNAPVNPRPAP